LAGVHLHFGAGGKDSNSPVPAAADKLKQALEFQKGLLERLRLDDDESIRREKHALVDICLELAEYYDVRERNSQFAAGFYTQCLRQEDGSSERAMLGLAKGYMSEGDYESCEKQLLQLQRLDSRSDLALEGSTLLAELLMTLAANGSRSEGGAQEYQEAAFQYRQLLERQPTNWSALSKVIYLLKRSGQVREFPKFLKAAEVALSATRNPDQEPGYRYVKGLYERSMNRPAEALVDLNFARTRDVKWREEATLAMIDIYMFPDSSRGSLEALQDASNCHSEQHSREVESLLQDLFQASNAGGNGNGGGGGSGVGSARLRVLQSQNAILTKRKADVEKGLQLLVELFNEDRNYVPALLAMSQALLITKASTKARNQLKRIAELARKSYNPAYAEDFEKAWLLLSDLYLQSGKPDMASQLCHLASSHNRSAGRAWETLGLIHEKNHAYKEACQHYERAWEICNRNSPHVGFRLAFNYLKAKRLLDCVLVCQQVLNVSENYPRIQKEILEKARAQMRV